MNLLDSNVVIAGASREGAALDETVFAHPYATSVITRIEVLGFSRLTAEDEADLRAVLAGGPELGLTEDIVRVAIRWRPQRRMSLGDALSAATALVHGLPLLTRNVDDFKHVAGLRMIDPFVTAPWFQFRLRHATNRCTARTPSRATAGHYPRDASRAEGRAETSCRGRKTSRGCAQGSRCRAERSRGRYKGVSASRGAISALPGGCSASRGEVSQTLQRGLGVARNELGGVTKGSRRRVERSEGRAEGAARRYKGVGKSRGRVAEERAEVPVRRD